MPVKERALWRVRTNPPSGPKTHKHKTVPFASGAPSDSANQRRMTFVTEAVSSLQSTTLHEWHDLKTRVFASGYTRPRPEIGQERHDHAYSTTYGKCEVTTAQLDAFMMRSYRKVQTQAGTWSFREVRAGGRALPSLGPSNPPSGNPNYRPVFAWVFLLQASHKSFTKGYTQSSYQYCDQAALTNHINTACSPYKVR